MCTPSRLVARLICLSDCAFRRTLAVAEEAGNGSIDARRFCVEECKRSATTTLQSASDLVDAKLKGYSTLDELSSVRELVQTASKLAATGRHTFAGRFVDESEGENADKTPTMDAICSFFIMQLPV